jgi:hypothetical protein
LKDQLVSLFSFSRFSPFSSLFSDCEESNQVSAPHLLSAIFISQFPSAPFLPRSGSRALISPSTPKRRVRWPQPPGRLQGVCGTQPGRLQDATTTNTSCVCVCSKRKAPEVLAAGGQIKKTAPKILPPPPPPRMFWPRDPGPDAAARQRQTTAPRPTPHARTNNGPAPQQAGSSKQQAASAEAERPAANHQPTNGPRATDRRTADGGRPARPHPLRHHAPPLATGSATDMTDRSWWLVTGAKKQEDRGLPPRPPPPGPANCQTPTCRAAGEASSSGG